MYWSCGKIFSFVRRGRAGRWVYEEVISNFSCYSKSYGCWVRFSTGVGGAQQNVGGAYCS